jgi:hypothetical protein
MEKFLKVEDKNKEKMHVFICYLRRIRKPSPTARVE